MVAIPANPVTQDDLTQWAEMQKKLADLKSAEALLRAKIFKGYFPNPVEGTNTAPLNAGWVIKATYPLSRKPLVDQLTSRAQEFRDAGIPLDDVIKYKPEVSVSDYRKLTDVQRQLLDQVLEIKPGSPQMEIMLPKNPKV